MTKDEALKLALHGLEMGVTLIEDFGSKEQLNTQHKAIAAIYEAFEQAKQESVTGIQYAQGIPFFPPPQRTWVGLTKEERHEISMANRPYCADVMAAHEEELKRRNT